MTLPATLIVLAAAASPLDVAVERAVKNIAASVKPTPAGPITIQRATAEGRILIMHAVATPETDPAALRQTVAPAVGPTVCGNLTLRLLMAQHGVRYRLTVTGRPSAEPLTIDLAEADCTALEASMVRPEPRTPARYGAFEFKNIRSGDTAVMHAAQWTSNIVNACSAPIGPDGAAITICRIEPTQVSGVRTQILVDFGTSGRMQRLEGTFEPSDFPIISQAFMMKYGKPDKIGEDSYRNGFGVESKYPRLTWTFTDGALFVATHVSSGAVEYTFRFMTTDYLARAAARQPAPTVDF